jgi:hypothetical protein
MVSREDDMTRRGRIRAKGVISAIILVCFACSATASGKKREPDCQREKKGSYIQAACNGISVGAPKAFDNRTLTLMIESLDQTLKSQQQSYLDQKSVLAALSNVQGFSQTETSTNLSITGSPTPATDVKTTLNTGNVDANGNPLPNTFQRQTDVNRAAVAPQAPALDTLPAFQGFTPTYGSSASDLLNDQVNLTYQIFNLRLILERSLSDRLQSNSSDEENHARLQAVLGFNVTIDPPRTANDAVAVVEVTVKTNDSQNLSLVSLMPQEKTYIAAALNSKSNAFGGAAVVSAFQVGFSARKRGQVFYLYRDTDTVSYERMTGKEGEVVFGWMFRPVLGRRSVSPGLRQLFAIVALPNVDCIKRGEKDDKGQPCTAELNSKVRTYWKKYDRATLTSFEQQDANRASSFWYALSLGLSKPQIFADDSYENGVNYDATPVSSSAEYQDELKPKVSTVIWRPTGIKNIVISARGNNFFSQTKVALGDKTYATESEGLILKSNQSLDLTTTLDALVNGPGTVLGRYDIGVPLTNGSLPDFLPKGGVEVQSATLTPPLAGNRKIEIHLQSKASDDQMKELGQLQDAATSARIQFESLKKALDLLQAAKTPKERTQAQQQSDETRQTLAAAGVASDLQTLETHAKVAAGKVAQKRLDIYSLQLNKLPRAKISDALSEPETPIVSVNGMVLDVPYDISETTENHIQHVIIQASVKDPVVSDSGGGIVKVSWPFYPQDKWSATYRFFNPDLAFQVTRVSQKSILIGRVDGVSFTNGPETIGHPSPCWHLIAGDADVPLTSGCPKPASESVSDKKDKDKENDKRKTEPQGPIASLLSDYTVAAQVPELPDKAVLVAPNGSIYTLSIPEFKAKEETVKPIELKQYDSVWVEIKPGELATSASPQKGKKTEPPDLSKVITVEANGKTLLALKQEDKSAATADESKKKTPSVKSIKVEITRDLTAKPGTIDIAFHGAGNELLGTRQLVITRTEWGEKGEK